jgi:DNA-binding NtrC family response regulator
MLTEVQPSRVVATDCSSGHVLVVDDDPAVRHLISGFFGQHGIRTVSAMGRSAVARQLAGGIQAPSFSICTSARTMGSICSGKSVPVRTSWPLF